MKPIEALAVWQVGTIVLEVALHRLITVIKLFHKFHKGRSPEPECYILIKENWCKYPDGR